jgi:nitrate reductase delta subunit
LVFIEDYKNEDFLELQERFVSTFDRSRNHCLNLFEHIHGESRDRGQAMVNFLLLKPQSNLWCLYERFLQDTIIKWLKLLMFS